VHQVYKTVHRYSPTYGISYIQSTNICTEFFIHVATWPVFPTPHNVIDFIMLLFLVHKIFTYFIKSALKFQ